MNYFQYSMLRKQWATCCQEKQFLEHLEDMADGENYKEAETKLKGQRKLSKLLKTLIR